MEVPSKVFVSGNRNCYYGFCVAPPKLGVPSSKYENVLKHLMSDDELKIYGLYCKDGSFFTSYYTRQLNDLKLNFNH